MQKYFGLIFVISWTVKRARSPSFFISFVFLFTRGVAWLHGVHTGEAHMKSGVPCFLTRASKSTFLMSAHMAPVRFASCGFISIEMTLKPFCLKKDPTELYPEKRSHITKRFIFVFMRGFDWVIFLINLLCCGWVWVFIIFETIFSCVFCIACGS